MKNANYLLLGVLLVCTGLTSKAQLCSDSTGFPYTAMSGDPGFLPANVISCIQTGQTVEILVPFNAYDSVQNGGGGEAVTNMVINDVSNLPCGLCWAANNASRTYNAGESGCLVIRGNTTAPLGQYTLDVLLSFGLQNGTIIQRSVADIAGTTGKIIIRLVDGNDAIPEINYALSGNISSPCN